MVSGTTVRFVQMMVLMVAVTAGLATTIRFDDSQAWGCYAAAGLVPGDISAMNVVQTVSPNFEPLDECLARYGAESPAWLIAAWPLLLAASTLALFLALPRWRAWRGRVRFADPDEAVAAHLDRLLERSGLDRMPKVVVDERRTNSANAIVYGSDRRPVLRLDKGLTALRSRQPETFEAIVLHEFAHIAGRDITVTYLTVAMWRSFVFLVVLPFAVQEAVDIVGLRSSWAFEVELIHSIRGLALPAVAVMIVHFARSEVLRSREIYADRAAARNGALLRPVFDRIIRRAPDRRRLLRALAALWHTHPSPRARREALERPAELFRIDPALVFTTGVAAVLVADQSGRALPWSSMGPYALAVVPTLIAAALVTAVVGLALWRAAAWSAVHRADATSGVTSGAWLGAGMVVGELLLQRSIDPGWLPARPVLLVLPFAIGVLFCWWTMQCSRLWVGRWRGRSVLPVSGLVLTGAWVAVTAALMWWSGHGASWASGFRFDPGAVFDGYRLDPDYASAVDQPWAETVFGVLVAPLVAMFSEPLLWIGVAAAVAVPLAAWAIGPDTAVPLWVTRERGEARAQLPPLRRLLGAGMAGGATALALAIAAVAWVQQWSPMNTAPRIAEITVFTVAAAIAVLIGAFVAAVTGVALSGRYRLVSAIIPAQIAVALGLVGSVAVRAVDGCIDAIGVTRSQCDPEYAWYAWEAQSLMAETVTAVAFAVAVAIAALTGAISWMLHRRRPRPLRRGTSRPVFRTRLTAAAISAVTIGFGAAVSASEVNRTPLPESTGSGAAALLGEPTQAQLTEAERRLLVGAWWVYGGWERIEGLLDEVQPMAGDIDAVLEGEEPDEAVLLQGCGDLEAAVAEAAEFFPVPLPEADSLWQDALNGLGDASRACVYAVDQSNSALLDAAMSQLYSAIVSMETALLHIRDLALATEEATP
ncbi:hypothetical protein GCM10027447_31550 [Glycomyces halotolerans]